jgi:hypothetical protein
VNDVAARRAEVLVVVPTHDHASTLDLAVRSVLEQTVTDLDVVVVGDGVGDDTRAVMADLVDGDERVRFVDRRGEQARHEVITASGAPVVTYVGDDDLLLPDHVATMLELLVDHDFAHPYPVMVGPDGGLQVLPSDLSDPDCVAWHLHPNHNTVSLTGAAHTVDLYRRVPEGWQAPPPGRWPDHHMWEKFLRLPGARFATSPRSTTIKPPATGSSATAEERRAGLVVWWERMHRPGFRQEWDAEVEEAIRRSAIRTFMDQQVLREQAQELSDGVLALREHAGAVEADRDRVVLERDELVERLAATNDELDAIRATRTWRWHDRVTANPAVRRLYGRLRS